MGLRKTLYLQARFSVLSKKKQGQKNDINPSKGFPFARPNLFAGVAKSWITLLSSMYISSLVDNRVFSFLNQTTWEKKLFDKCKQCDVTHVETVCCHFLIKNHLVKFIWHLLREGIDGWISNGNITWLNTHQCRGNTGISNSTGWRPHSWILNFIPAIQYHTLFLL